MLLASHRSCPRGHAARPPAPAPARAAQSPRRSKPRHKALKRRKTPICPRGLEAADHDVTLLSAWRSANMEKEMYDVGARGWEQEPQSRLRTVNRWKFLYKVHSVGLREQNANCDERCGVNVVRPRTILTVFTITYFVILQHSAPLSLQSAASHSQSVSTQSDLRAVSASSLLS